MISDEELFRRFPLSHKYSPAWICENGMGANPLWQTEWLCQKLDLQPGMRVLDLGCGRAKSSIFLAREFDVEVWACDLWISASENWQQISQAQLERRVFPLHVDARALPFAAEFFDAMICVDAYSYFGTDSLYLNYLVHFVKEGGLLGIAGAGLTQEIELPLPENLLEFWSQDVWALHSAPWWKHLWERTGLVKITAADSMQDGWKLWSQWHRLAWPNNSTEIEAIERDAGKTFDYIRVIGRRQSGAMLADYAWPDTMRSMPFQYEQTPIERGKS